MNIAIFTDTFLPQINGVVTATISLAKGLSERGHKIYIICPEFKKNEKEFDFPNIKVIRIRSMPAYFYEDFRFSSPISLKLIKIFRKEKIDLIHFQTPMPLGFQAIIISKILKLPLVGTFHTFFGDPQYLQHLKLDFKLMEKVSWGYARFFYNKCNLITCPSETTKKELLKNRLKEPIKAISNGIDFSIFDNSKWKKVKEKYNKEGDIILFIGRITYAKNLFYLLECFKIVCEKIPSIKFLIVGDGPQFNEIKLKIKSLGIEKNVILTGKISHEELVKSSIFKACKLFVTASKTETFGLTTLEAGANGLPSVAIKAKGTEDIIKNDYNGYLVEDLDKEKFAEQIIKLLSDKNLYNRMKKNALNEAKKHSYTDVAKTWEKEYNLLISNLKKL